MLTSLALIFLVGLCLSSVFQRLRLPPLLGMIITGMILSPYALNLLDDSILGISADLRQLALVIILTRAGLSLDIGDLRQVGRPAVLLCFIPACFEIMAFILLAPFLLPVSALEAALMGSVIAAVSPAVVVPGMIKLMEEHYGTDKKIPQLILAGASVDDVFVIVLFTALVSLISGGGFSVFQFAKIPVSIFTGVGVGFICAWLLKVFFQRVHLRDSIKILIVLSVSFLMLALEDKVKDAIPVSGLLAIMSMGIGMRRYYPLLAKRLSVKYNKLWVAAEILLFVLVGAQVDLRYAKTAGVMVVLMIVTALVFRMLGVLLCLVRTPLRAKERFFCMAAYTPKATVQAAIGAIPLSMGFSCGNLILTAAVTAILITAPFGAVCIEKLYRKCLLKEEGNRT